MPMHENGMQTIIMVGSHASQSNNEFSQRDQILERIDLKELEEKIIHHETIVQMEIINTLGLHQQYGRQAME